MSNHLSINENFERKKTMIETVIGCCIDWDCDWVYLLKSDGPGGVWCLCLWLVLPITLIPETVTGIHSRTPMCSSRKKKKGEGEDVVVVVGITSVGQVITGGQMIT